MPRTQPALEDVSPPPRTDFHELADFPFAPGQFLISAEHASNRIPVRYKNLGLTRRQLQSHIAWDPGSLSIARACAKALGCPCHEGGHSRLLVDLNRSLHHPKLMARQSFSIPVPGNESLSREERGHRIRQYYAPFREAVLADVRRIIRARGRCVHLSVHSFTPVVESVARVGDIGILYDPGRRIEKALAAELIARITAQGFHVRRNFPYRGVSDGHVTGLRKLFSERRYEGLEVEVNQRLLQREGDIRRVARQIAAAVASLVVGA
jgi:predicted N-formylglutamate amidohydrolase